MSLYQESCSAIELQADTNNYGATTKCRYGNNERNGTIIKKRSIYAGPHYGLIQAAMGQEGKIQAHHNCIGHVCAVHDLRHPQREDHEGPLLRRSWQL